MCWALALLGMYAQPQLVESIMADRGALEGAVGQTFAFENGAFFITLLLASGPIAKMSRARTALVGILVLRELGRSPALRDDRLIEQSIQSCLASADYREGVQAFLDKRPAKFRGV